MRRGATPKSSPALVIWAALVATLIAGCEDDLPKATLIEHMRVLGARTEVVGDEARSTPRLGEIAMLNWAVTYPELTASDDDLSSLFLVCTAPTTFAGTPACEELIEAAQAGESPIDVPSDETTYSCEGREGDTVQFGGIKLTCLSGTPRVEVAIEDDFPAAAKLVQGVICRNGTPELDLQSSVGVRCDPKPGADESQVESIAVYGTVSVAREESDENLNPSRDRIELYLRVPNSGAPMPWLASPPDQTLEQLEQACVDGTSPRRDRFRQFISIGYGPDDEDEELQFSTVATYGEMSRRFTVIEPEDRSDNPAADEEAVSEDDDIRPSEFAWSPTADQRSELEDEPQLVRFYISVLDGRGGFDVATRELCVGESE
jgi:hypothetical protein